MHFVIIALKRKENKTLKPKSRKESSVDEQTLTKEEKLI